MRNCQSTDALFWRHEKQREDARYFRSINTAKPLLNITSPKKMKHLKLNKKREALKEIRDMEIKHNNRLLLKQMLRIDLTPSSYNPT